MEKIKLKTDIYRLWGEGGEEGGIVFFVKKHKVKVSRSRARMSIGGQYRMDSG
jgi:hypothetical protein